MNCYVHPEKEAVGICAKCRKFICSECSEKFGDGYFAGIDPKIKDKNYCKKCASKVIRETIEKLEPLPRNNIILHIILLLFTFGIGNIIYFLYIRNRQKQWFGRYR